MARAQKWRKMQVLMEFEAPSSAEFWEIRDYVIEELECSGGNRRPDDPMFNSLRNVMVSKPITPWRREKNTSKPSLRIVK